MRKFAVQIHGNGFAVPLEAGAVTEGFYVTVFIEAEDEDDACGMALAHIVDNAEFHETIGVHADPDEAEVFVEGWAELEDFEDCILPHSGFVFYGPENSIQ